MRVDGRRVWIDSHIHIRGYSPERGPRDFPIEAVTEVLERDPDHLVWVISHSFPETNAITEDPATGLRWSNEGQYRLVQEAPPGRVFGSLAIHPDAVKESREEIDLFGGERGFVQVGEILGYAMGFALDSPEMIEIAKHAAELGLPLQCHCSTSGQPFGNQIRQTIRLAQEVPEAKIIAAHALGGGNSWMHITAAEVYFAMGGENLWLEIRDFNTREYLRAAVERLGAERLIAGTDWIARDDPPFPPYGILFPQTDVNEMPYPSCVASLAGFLREAGCTEEDVDRIACRNSIELFGLEGRLAV